MIASKHIKLHTMKSENDEKTYLEEYGDTLLKRKGISKTEFAERMGVKKQNVYALLATKNILLLKKAAQVLGIPLETLIGGNENPALSINGFVEVNERMFRIKSKEDYLNVLRVIEETEQGELN